MTDPTMFEPTMFEYAGGAPAISALAATHYGRCVTDPVLAEVFADLKDQRVARRLPRLDLAPGKLPADGGLGRRGTSRGDHATPAEDGRADGLLHGCDVNRH